MVLNRQDQRISVYQQINVCCFQAASTLFRPPYHPIIHITLSNNVSFEVYVLCSDAIPDANQSYA